MRTNATRIARVRNRRLACFLAVGLVGGLMSWAPSQAENWPQWRGPRGTGVSGERSVPLFWGHDRRLLWKCPLPPWGDSTPVVWGDSIFVTTQTEDGRLLLLHINAGDGRIWWTREVGRGTVPREGPKRGRRNFHRLHNLASPSPVTDGKTVVVHFGNGELAAYDYGGTQLWKRNLQEQFGPYTVWYGHANSPVLFGELVISVCMQDSLADVQEKKAQSYIVAHELSTGKTRWKATRMTGAKAEQCDAYTTPLVVRMAGRFELIVMGGNQLDAYDPHTGEQLWYLPELVGGRTVSSPTFGGGFVFATRGLRGPLFAVRIGRVGKLTRRDIAWSYSQGTPDSCSLVAWDTLLFAIADNGITRCFDTMNGKLKWKKRLPGQYKASPVAVDGRILFLNTEGLCTVVLATSQFHKLAENALDEPTIASPAIANGRIYIRGRNNLYCIGAMGR